MLGSLYAVVMEEGIQENRNVNRQQILAAKSNWKTWKSRFLIWEPHYQLNESFQVLKQCPQDKMYANQRPLVAIRAFPCTGADESTFGVRVWSLTWQTKTRPRFGGWGGYWRGDEPVKLTGYRSRIRNHLGCCEWRGFFSSIWPLLSLWYEIVNGIQNRRATHWSEMRTMQGARVPITFAMGEGAVFLERSHS